MRAPVFLPFESGSPRWLPPFTRDRSTGTSLQVYSHPRALRPFKELPLRPLSFSLGFPHFPFRPGVEHVCQSCLAVVEMS